MDHFWRRRAEDRSDSLQLVLTSQLTNSGGVIPLVPGAADEINGSIYAFENGFLIHFRQVQGSVFTPIPEPGSVLLTALGSLLLIKRSPFRNAASKQ